ncbi:MAG: EamA family transporter [Dehalococcoidia bacterium]
MSLAILLAGVALLVGGLADLLYRVAQNRGIDSGLFIFWQSVIFAVILWVYAIFSGDILKLDTFTWLIGLPGGALGYVGLTLFLLSVKTGDVSVNAPIFRLNFVITSAGAMILLGESFALAKLVGITLALLSVISFAGIKSLNFNSSQLSSLALVSLGSIVFGIVGILIKYGLNNDAEPIPLLLTQTIAFQVAASIYVVYTKKWKPNQATRRYSPWIAVLQLIWASLTLTALSFGEASIIYPIVQLSFVVTAILGIILLHEEFTKGKGLGILLALGAVGALAIA